MTLLCTLSRFIMYRLVYYVMVVLSCFVMHEGALAQEVILKAEIQNVVQMVQGRTYPGFRAFLTDVEKRSTNRTLQRVIRKFRINDDLSENEWTNVYRLVGIFVRTQYRDQMLSALKELVDIRTDSLPGVHPYENPNMIRLGKIIERMAGEFGLTFRNADGRVFEVILNGNMNSEDSFGIYTHADVVPADAKDWILDDGTKLEPYEMRVIDDKIYGRGTEDDKASIVSALFAMRGIRESGLTLKKNVRLIIETTEEIGGSGFEYYKSKYDVPEYNVVLDNLYPVVTAEKGFLMILTDFTVRQPVGDGIRILDITGGTSITSIPATSTVTLRTSTPLVVKAKLDAMARTFIHGNGANFKIESSVENDSTVEVVCFGVSAHSSVPETGVNPVPIAFVFLHAAMQELSFQSNHFTDAVHYVYDNYGLDLYGKKMGIDYSDDFMGPLTVTLTTVTLTQERLRIGVSGRPPRGKAVNDLKREVEEKLADYRNRRGFRFDPTVRVWDFMYRNPEGRWINTLLDIFGDVTGMEARPVSSNGGTTAKLLPNAVSFGPGMPGEKYMGHTVNEFKGLENFLLDAQMFTEMILRIGNLESMIE